MAAMNGPRTWAGSAAVRVVAWLVRDDTSRFCSSAPTAAVPITRPTWRTVFSTPDAAPLIRGSMLRMATVTRGANVQPMPNPPTISAGRKSYHAELGVAIRAAQPIPAANRAKPVMRMACHRPGSSSAGHGRDEHRRSEAGAT